MNTSLRGRLLLALGAGSVAVWLTLAAWQYRQIRHQVDLLFDAHIAEAAAALHGVIRSEALEHAGIRTASAELERFVLTELERHTQGPAYGRDHFYQVTFGRTAQYYQSPGAPAVRFAADGQHRFRTRHLAGTDWRIFTVETDGPEGPLTVTVGEPMAVRTPAIGALAMQLGAGLAGGALLLALLVLHAVHWALRPLRALAAAVQQRDPNHLDALAPDILPGEVAPLVAALNGLLLRLDEALAAERQFTADAAHELRSPLAALKVQAQVAARALQPAQRNQALAQLLVGVDRATRLVEQLLTLARVDPDIGSADFAIVAVHDVVTECLYEMANDAAQRGVTLINAVPPELTIRANAGALAIALHNLLDNALRYGPQGGRVEVSGQTTAGGGVELAVVDQGDGIPPERRSDVLRRFYRLPGTGANGSGLGLAIVQRIARLHGAELKLGDGPTGGLAVVLRFPP